MTVSMFASIAEVRKVFEVSLEGLGRKGKERKGKGREGKGREGKGREGKEREGQENNSRFWALG